MTRTIAEMRDQCDELGRDGDSDIKIPIEQMRALLDVADALEVYACDSSVHSWGNDDHPCFDYQSCRALKNLEAAGVTCA
jgi:hypothetical protein